VGKHTAVQPSEIEAKVCLVCGRTMQWRKAWAKNWAEVKYCSDRCRSSRNAPELGPLEAAILRLLADREASSTICPSEAARLVGGEDWRDLMEPARAAARRLVDRHEVVITQGGLVVDPSTAKGPIRIRLVESPAMEPALVRKRKPTGLDD
jgi:hypothetical protein